MYYGIVANGYIIAQHHLCLLVSTMDTGPVLYIHLIAYADAIDIATDYGIEPHTAILTHDHIPYYSGIGGYKTPFGYLRGYSFYWQDNRHNV
jgi:hypothetical protein